MDLSELRAEFPVLERLAYLNAGTDGPLPARAVDAAKVELVRELQHGRTQAHFERRGELNDALRALYARALGCEVADVALTTCTSEGMGQVIAGLGLGPDDEILTSDEEHPGLLGALGAARELYGVSVREVPLDEIAGAVSPATRLLACSHVGWVSGRIVPAELAQVQVPVLLDGAQGVGAIDVDVHALGCDAYAGAGQKWMCGPDGTGMLYVSPSLRERLAVTRRAYTNLAEPNDGVDAQVQPDARRFDAPSLSAEEIACALTSAELLFEVGFAAVHAQATRLAEELVGMLAEAGRQPEPRGESTLVSFQSPDPDAERATLAQAGVIVRNIPGRDWLRASVGAWNNREDLERLLGALYE